MQIRNYNIYYDNIKLLSWLTWFVCCQEMMRNRFPPQKIGPYTIITCTQAPCSTECIILLLHRQFLKVWLILSMIDCLYIILKEIVRVWARSHMVPFRSSSCLLCCSFFVDVWLMQEVQTQQINGQYTGARFVSQPKKVQYNTHIKGCRGTLRLLQTHRFFSAL